MTSLRAQSLLNARISWLHLLGHLDVDCLSTALPTKTYCPLCDEEGLQIFMDWGLNGQWFHCLSCHNHGDMIELAAKTWKLSILAAVRKLAREGFDLPTDKAAIQCYVERYVKGRQRMAALWRHSRRGTIHSSTTLRGLVHELRLHCEAPTSRWGSGFGQLVGAIGKLEVEKAFYPGSVAARQVSRRKHHDGHAGNPSMYRIFKGRGWDDVLVVPFYDLPGKICSFLFIGRDGNPKEDFVFKRINYHNTKAYKVTEAGLAFHPDALATADTEWKRTVFAFRDPVLALQLQARHFEGSTRPLPLVVWYESRVGSPDFPDRTRHAWEMLEGRQTVFWMPKVDVALLCQAAMVDGLISVAGPERRTSAKLKRYTWKFPPANLLEHIRRQAKPWHRVLSDMVDVLPDAVVEELFVKFKDTGEHVLRLVQKCRPASQVKLRKIFTDQDTLITISYNRHTILERRDGWYLTGPKYNRNELVLLGKAELLHEAVEYTPGNLVRRSPSGPGRLRQTNGGQTRSNVGCPGDSLARLQTRPCRGLCRPQQVGRHQPAGQPGCFFLDTDRLLTHDYVPPSLDGFGKSGELVQPGNTVAATVAVVVDPCLAEFECVPKIDSCDQRPAVHKLQLRRSFQIFCSAAGQLQAADGPGEGQTRQEKWKILLGKRQGVGHTAPYMFYNEVCGESFDTGARLITQSDAVLGMLPDGRIHVIYGWRSLTPHLHNEEARYLLHLAQAFRCSHIVHDYGGAGAVRETLW